MGSLASTPHRAARRPAFAACAVAAVLVVIGCQDNGASADHASRAASPSATAPSPPTGPLPAPPRTVPAVRGFVPEAGPGWKPGADTRIVADPAGPLADEARTLAGELHVETASGPSHSGDLELSLDTDHSGGPESYALTVRDGRARISGSGQAGVYYGTRTVVQAMRTGGTLPQGVVTDGPDRAQRGLHLDMARKFFSAKWIEARLRELASLKLNQLALHFSDDQGFRIASSSHPEIVSKDHLTKAELRRIVRLARSLHITVIPEIDSPGHLGAVLRAHPSLQLHSAAGVPVRGALDISKPAAADIVDDLIKEFAPLFPGAYWHLGGDEYTALMYRNPQASFPGLAAAARKRYGPKATVADLATGWLNDRAAVARRLGKRPKAWNDGFFAGGVAQPDRHIEVEYWTGKEISARLPQRYLNEGRTVVNLNDEYLYYVLGEPNNFRYPTGERIYRQWSPAVLRGTAPVPGTTSTEPSKVPGARLAVWCDLAGAQTPAQVAAGIRMPLRALAQRLWDPRTPRLSWHDFETLARRAG